MNGAQHSGADNTTVTRLLLPAAALALAVFGGSASPAGASPQVRFVTDVHGVGVGSAAVRCLPAGRAAAVLTVGTGTRRPASWVALVGGRVAARGVTRPDAQGLLHPVVPVPANEPSRVQVTAGRRSLLDLVVRASCTPAAPAPRRGAPAPAAPANGRSGATPVPAAGASSSYVLHRASNGTVVRWDPCGGAIHVRVDVARAGPGALDDVRTALARVAQATGLSLVFDGTTAAVPSTKSAQDAALVIAWASPGTGAGQSDLFESGAVGEGGYRLMGTSTDGQTWAWRIVSGFVVLDPAYDPGLAVGFGAGQTRGQLLLHELGHVFGLSHTSDISQVMYPVLQPSGSGAYGAGDQAGLAAVGASQGCVTAS